MRFKNVIEYKDLEEKSNEIYMTVLHTWEEYNPVICDPKDEEKLKKLSKQLLTKLQEAAEIIDEMDKIRIDSFGC